MKKVIFTLLIMVALVATSQAQALKFGPTLGLSTNDVTLSGQQELILSGSTDSLSLSIDENSRYGVHFGFRARVNLLGFYIQPGILLSTTGMNYTVEDLKNANQIRTDIQKETFFNVDVPILIGYKLGPIRAQAGPTASFLIANNSDLTDVAAYQEGWENAYWSFGLGLGFDISKISVDATYEFGLGEYVNTLEFQGNTFAMNTNRNRIVVLLTYNLIGN